MIKAKGSLLCTILLILLILFAISFSLFIAKPTREKSIYRNGFFFDTFISITLYGTDDTSLLDRVFELCSYYEEIFDCVTTDTAALAEPLSSVISYGNYYSELSNGAFDITLAPVTSLWNFKSEAPIVPTASEIEAALLLDGYDFGGIAKGYIADRIRDFLLEQAVESAYINLGGNILCINGKPDGSDFRVGIQYPFKPSGELIELLNINNLSVVTAGSYNRCFTKDGILYHHILDPSTGYPADSGLLSVTVIAKESVAADALSTACFVLGLEKGIKLIENLENTYALFITEDYECHYSKGFEKFIAGH